MKKIVLTLLALGIGGSAYAAPQTKCPDPAVTNVSATQIKARGQLARYRFVVEVTNQGGDAFVTGPDCTVALLFSTNTKQRRSMATQPLPNLAVGEVTTLIFEADVETSRNTLPQWEDMPFPAEICGVIQVKVARGATRECDTSNNRLCVAP